VTTDGVKAFSDANDAIDGKAMAVIFSCISDSLGTKFISSTAYEMWQGLNAMFDLQTTGSLITELRELINLRMMSDDDNPIEYWYSTSTKWDNFCTAALDLRTAGRLVALTGLAPGIFILETRQ
ncbi:hypothetical protein H4S06_001083, partial [Coemansia sp. BCRC 34490]